MENTEMKSNINILSNVYIRTKSDEYGDIKYINQITGYNALMKLAEKATTSLIKINLTKSQEQELINSIPCNSINNKLDEQTFGAVKIDDEIVWSCRCENTDCKNYDECMNLPNSKKIDRNHLTLELENKTLVIEKPQLNETIFDESNKIIVSQSSNINENFYFDDTAFNYKKIDDIKEIVESDVNDTIFINSSSGSGKTYTIIQKLEYILDNNIINNHSNILVLCYSKTTQNLIRGNFFDKGKDILITTLDSFATKTIFEQVTDDITSLSYDSIIEKFNNEIKNIDLSNFELIIVDELHDLQNQRAMMALNILKKVNCGILLLGDKCQALYQQNTQNSISIDVVRLYNLLNKILPRNTKKYELIYKDKLTKSLNIKSKNIRDALLYKNLIEAKKVILREFDDIETELTTIEKFKPIVKNNETIAFLCKSDSEAEYVSSILYKNKIHHNLLRNLPNKYSYNRWIADVLWDHCSKNIEKDDFIQRYTSRVYDNYDFALQLYNLLLNFSTEYEEINDDSFICKKELLQKFINGKEPPIEFTNKNNQNIIVSTIVKSKGEHFDNVYLVDFELSNLMEESVRLDKLHEIYVSFIRAKNNVKLINFKNKINFKQTPLKHSYRTYQKYNEEFCTHFSIGDDIAIECFLHGTFKEVLFNQQYMSEIVNVNDKVELILFENSYQIYHIQNTKTSKKQTKYLGLLSNKTFLDLKNALLKYNNGKLPLRLYDLYISQVVTVPQNNNEESVPVQLKNSNFTIGIEISGFAKVDLKN